MTADTTDYKNLAGEIIKKQIAILGPDIAIAKARQVQGLRVDDSGVVLAMEGNSEMVLQSLVDKYIELSGDIVKNILNPVFAKYPNISIKIN